MRRLVDPGTWHSRNQEGPVGVRGSAQSHVRLPVDIDADTAKQTLVAEHLQSARLHNLQPRSATVVCHVVRHDRNAHQHNVLRTAAGTDRRRSARRYHYHGRPAHYRHRIVPHLFTDQRHRCRHIHECAAARDA